MGRLTPLVGVKRPIHLRGKTPPGASYPSSLSSRHYELLANVLQYIQNYSFCLTTVITCNYSIKWRHWQVIHPLQLQGFAAGINFLRGGVLPRAWGKTPLKLAKVFLQYFQNKDDYILQLSFTFKYLIRWIHWHISHPVQLQDLAAALKRA